MVSLTPGGKTQLLLEQPGVATLPPDDVEIFA
jgi:hypothetical protein